MAGLLCNSDVGLERRTASPTELSERHFDGKHFGKAKGHGGECLTLRIFGLDCRPGAIRHIKGGRAVAKEQNLKLPGVRLSR
jgi:hypothetical protein